MAFFKSLQSGRADGYHSAMPTSAAGGLQCVCDVHILYGGLWVKLEEPSGTSEFSISQAAWLCPLMHCKWRKGFWSLVYRTLALHDEHRPALHWEICPALTLGVDFALSSKPLILSNQLH